MELPRNWISRSLAIMLSVVVVDQLCKYIVLQTMYRGQSIDLIGDWLKLTFTENPGMAFGIEFGPPALITIFSLIATVLIVLYLFKVGGIYRPYRISLSMVLGGAFGNIIDRVFYGKILYDDPFFLGKVVDFIHFNVWRGIVPEAVPLLGGKYLALFPIWNVADMAIVLGVVGILSFQRRFHELIEAQSEKGTEPLTSEGIAAASALPSETGREGEDPGKQQSV
ncbi:MAG: signal peptidase II [Bacteroidetes bacterium]|nr:signal peptidase II [Bacteroidota bacterium]MDA0873541.1 signal peptidase II [Bacteroidota bacterium]